MKWFKKNSDSDPLESEKRRLDDELQEVRKRIQDAQLKEQTISEPNPSPYSRMSVVRTNIPTHLDSAPLSGQEETLLKTPSTTQRVKSQSDEDPSQGKFNPWPFINNFLILFHLRRSSTDSSSSSKDTNTFNTKGGTQVRKTRREMMIIRRRVFLLGLVFLLILWGIFLMFLKS